MELVVALGVFVVFDVAAVLFGRDTTEVGSADRRDTDRDRQAAARA